MKPALLGVAIAAALAVAVVSSTHAQHPESSPVSAVGGWGPAWTWSIFAALVLYGASIVLNRRHVHLMVATGIAVAVQAIPLGAPLLLSKDVYAYWSQARMVTAHDANPYVTAPSRYPSDPSYPHVDESWRNTTTAYGPVWEFLGLAPAAGAGASSDAAQLAYRALAFLGVLAAIGLVARGTRNARAVAFVGWNPLLALHSAGGGHNDAWLAALAALAALGSARARGGAATAAGALLKGVPALFVPLELAKRRFRMPRAYWLGLATILVAIAVPATLLFGGAWITRSFTGVGSPSGLGGVHWLEELGLRYRYAVGVCGGAFALVYALLVLRAWRSGRAHLSLMTSALCLATAQLRPWYAVWPVVLAGAEEDASAYAAAFGLTAYLLLGDAVRL